MSTIYSVIALILFWSFIIGLFFLFSGTPDLWDKLHQLAMTGVCK